MASAVPPTVSNEATEPAYDFHEMRITNHGKINAWVDFALQFFEANEAKALVLHTLPITAQASATSKPGPTRNVSLPTTTIPRLISVVEIIKREYLKMMNEKMWPGMEGLHQYNEIGCLEDMDEWNVPIQEQSVEDRASELISALGGTKNVREKRTAYMKVTLCRQEIPNLGGNGATYQRPMKRKLTKSAKGRLKKRLKKQTERVEDD
ncbi:hypothetical protein HETIRDRAFT_316269 [Heterobasidion irregulare TC 32-1]|uniref:Uncharacterized protein n=1 Tax=Heterobasidion irregulare (strain TC 32-1) TaxID=747525 RepID=W4KAW4_HETIT|nr:uncharacterized protein HETIRDRAFT_316269 [Heterobasidion irregulare TC 32-1]ETW82928.1 hypothetical protein HETIRDRAFT_316269 [Heterobasidion irregulare TC 32-1]